MRFEISRQVPDPDRVKAICRAVAKAARVTTPGLLVTVQRHGHGRYLGRCWGDACTVYRGGKAVQVNGYIKLHFRDWEQLAETFAHELSHLRDSRLPKVPWGKEKRAKAFAEKIMDRMAMTKSTQEEAT